VTYTEGWYTPLHLALGNGWIDTAYYLLDCGATPTIINKYVLDPMTFAEKKGFVDVAKRFRLAVKAKSRESTLKNTLQVKASRSESRDHDDDDNWDDHNVFG
jgi:ankyrin repeat protein